MNGRKMRNKYNSVIWYNPHINIFVIEEFGTGDNLLPIDKEDGYIGYTNIGSFEGNDETEVDITDDISTILKLNIDEDYTADELYINGTEMSLIDGGQLLYKTVPILNDMHHLKDVLYQLNLQNTKEYEWMIIKGTK